MHKARVTFILILVTLWLQPLEAKSLTSHCLFLFRKQSQLSSRLREAEPQPGVVAQVLGSKHPNASFLDLALRSSQQRLKTGEEPKALVELETQNLTSFLREPHPVVGAKDTAVLDTVAKQMEVAQPSLEGLFSIVERTAHYFSKTPDQRTRDNFIFNFAVRDILQDWKRFDLLPIVMLDNPQIEDFVPFSFHPIAGYGLSKEPLPFDGIIDDSNAQFAHDRLHAQSQAQALMRIYATSIDLEKKRKLMLLFAETGDRFLESLYRDLRQLHLSGEEARAVDIEIFFSTHERRSMNNLKSTRGTYGGMRANFLSDTSSASLPLIKTRMESTLDMGKEGLRITTWHLKFARSLIADKLAELSKKYDRSILNEQKQLLGSAYDEVFVRP